MKMRGIAVPLCLLVLSGCGTRDSANDRAQVVSLQEGVAARVGDEEISVELVEQIARAQSVSARAARDLAVSDAVFAAHARERFRGTGRVESAERSALLRALLEQLKAEAQAAGPPTDAEVEEVTRLRWLDLDRPAMARTIHAVVQVQDGERRAEAKEVADRLAKVLEGVKDPTEFEKRAKELDAGELKLTVETLAPVASDGRVGTPASQPGSEGPRFDAAFAAAANALESPGDHSPVVESAFGFHVIMLLEKIAEYRPTLEQRRAAVRREVMQRRGAALQAELLQRAGKSRRVEMSQGVESLVGQIRVSQ